MFEEYAELGVRERPSSCEDFTQSGGSTHFGWEELNGGWANGNPHARWGWVQSALTTGLERTRANYGDQPIRITSGYRCPHGNASIRGADPQSAHQSGRAADMYSVNKPWTKAEFDELLEAADAAGGDPYAPKGYYTYADRHLHVRAQRYAKL